MTEWKIDVIRKDLDGQAGCHLLNCNSVLVSKEAGELVMIGLL